MAARSKRHWLVKSEPVKYSWDQFVKDGSTYWDGVRNYTARNNLRDMKKGDLVFFYHSNEGKDVVGVARVIKESYPDPTTDDDRWLVVDLKPVKALAEPVTLAAIKADAQLADMELVKQSRLSVSSVGKKEFERILKLGKTTIR
jgi:predicted RNA-binding protein with PUA-like domain